MGTMFCVVAIVIIGSSSKRRVSSARRSDEATLLRGTNKNCPRFERMKNDLVFRVDPSPIFEIENRVVVSLIGRIGVFE